MTVGSMRGRRPVHTPAETSRTTAPATTRPTSSLVHDATVRPPPMERRPTWHYPSENKPVLRTHAQVLDAANTLAARVESQGLDWVRGIKVDKEPNRYTPTRDHVLIISVEKGHQQDAVDLMEQSKLNVRYKIEVPRTGGRLHGRGH